MPSNRSRSSGAPSAALSLSNRRLYLAQRIRGGLSGYSSSAGSPPSLRILSPCRNGSVEGRELRNSILKIEKVWLGGTHKDEGAVDNGCALGNRPSTGSKCGRWAAGCFYNAVGIWWFLPAGRRKQKESLGCWAVPRLSSPDGWPDRVPAGVSRIVRTPNQAGVQCRADNAKKWAVRTIQVYPKDLPTHLWQAEAPENRLSGWSATLKARRGSPSCST
jgi:hypothetical protein